MFRYKRGFRWSQGMRVGLLTKHWRICQMPGPKSPNIAVALERLQLLLRSALRLSYSGVHHSTSLRSSGYG
ncbi:hypothetical protein D9M68_468890 [compost metagenome]